MNLDLEEFELLKLDLFIHSLTGSKYLICDEQKNKLKQIFHKSNTFPELSAIHKKLHIIHHPKSKRSCYSLKNRPCRRDTSDTLDTLSSQWGNKGIRHKETCIIGKLASNWSDLTECICVGDVDIFF